MAYVQIATMSNLKDAVEDALAYAGAAFSDLTVTWGAHVGTNVEGVQIRIGEGTTDNLLATATIGGSNSYFGAAISSGPSAFGTWTGKASNNFRVVATKSALAIMNLNSSGVSAKGLVITRDDAGALCGIVSNSTDNALTTPTVVPRDEQYTTAINYTGAPSTAFTCTSLARIPVPTFGAAAKYLPDMSFAHATQYLVDGSVTLNNIKYYSLGGAWFLRDVEE